MNSLEQRFRQYSGWRSAAIAALDEYRQAAANADLSDPSLEQRLEQAVSRLADDKLVVAFVAEYSRGKSELINAIFFADYGRRILPSSAGRTTMCPTELMHDHARPPSIRLLPIETRCDARSLGELRSRDDAWITLPLDIASGDAMLEALAQVSLTKKVTLQQARDLGLIGDDDTDLAVDGMIDISRWRHAIVNFPHALLRQGLVIIDTPGLNALGTEPELALNLLPNADAVLFVVGADTGVTKSDAQAWRDHVGTGQGRMAVMNKIDTLWDELRSADQIAQQIDTQVKSVADVLAIEPSQVFAVSAQKGLLAKVGGDDKLLARSGIPALEDALATRLIPQRQQILRARLEADLAALKAARSSLQDGRIRGVTEQLLELKSLRGKNRAIVEHMMQRIDMERGDFDESLVKLRGMRAVFSRLSAEVFQHLGMETLKNEIFGVREAMGRSIFSVGMRDAVRQFFDAATDNLAISAAKAEEISDMLAVMYRRFSAEHGLSLTAPMRFSMQEYLDQVRETQALCLKQFGAAAMLTTSQTVLMQQFFDTIAARVRQIYLTANRDVEAWLKVVMAPLEVQVREHRAQLKQRRLSVERIHLETDRLEEKVLALEAMQQQLEQQRRSMEAVEQALEQCVSSVRAPLRRVA